MMRQLQQKIWLARFVFVYRRSRPAFERWQSRALQHLVQYAFQHVPLYKRLYKDLDIKTLTLENITRIPIIDKDFIRTKPSEECIDGSRAINSIWKSTSGSTGKPLLVLQSDAMCMPPYIDFGCYRFALGSLLLPYKFNSMRIARIDIHTKKDWKENQLTISIPDFLRDPERVAREIAEYRPTIVTSFASILVELAKTAANNPSLPPIRPRYAVSSGEILTPAMRQYITTTFQCEVYNRYATEEGGLIAIECSEHNGMHINVESAIVEIIDDSGKPVPENTYGRVVITNLLNYNMPFIRYAVGDHGMLSYAPCLCGLETPRIWIDGRYSAFLEFGGRKFHHFEFDFIEHFPGVTQYQIAKTGNDRLAIRIVPTPQFTQDIEAKIIGKMQEIVGEQVQISFEQLEAIPLTSRGKSKVVIDETILS